MRIEEPLGRRDPMARARRDQASTAAQTAVGLDLTAFGLKQAGNDLEGQVTRLLSSYAAALGSVRDADILTRGLVVDVIESSARAATQAVGTREPTHPDLRARLETYANDVQHDNVYKSARGVAFELAKLAHNGGAVNLVFVFVVGGGLVALVSNLAGDVQDAGRAGGTTSAYQMTRMIWILGATGGLAALWKWISDQVSSSFAATNPARELLAVTIDQPELELFSRWGVGRPSRPSLDGASLVIGWGTVVAIGLGLAVVAFIVLNYIAGALAPAPLPTYDSDIFDSLLPTRPPLFDFGTPGP
jgi:hypothetical protein